MLTSWSWIAMNETNKQKENVSYKNQSHGNRRMFSHPDATLLINTLLYNKMTIKIKVNKERKHISPSFNSSKLRNLQLQRYYG